MHIDNGGTANIGSGVVGLANYLNITNSSTLNITNSGKVNATGAIRIGTFANYEGTITVSGVGSELNSSWLTVGDEGTGNLSLTGGGTATATGSITIGSVADSEGTVTVNGTGSELNTALLYVGSSGTGNANLLVRSGNYNSLRMPVGAKLSQDFWSGGIIWTPELRAFYIREMADASVRTGTSFATAPGIPFYAESGKWGRNSGRFGAGMNAQLSNWLNFRVDYDYEVYDHTATNELSATLGVRW